MYPYHMTDQLTPLTCMPFIHNHPPIYPAAHPATKSPFSVESFTIFLWWFQKGCVRARSLAGLSPQTKACSTVIVCLILHKRRWSYVQAGLLGYGKYHDHDYFDQSWNHDYSNVYTWVWKRDAFVKFPLEKFHRMFKKCSNRNYCTNMCSVLQ